MTGKIFNHKLYGEYEVINRLENRGTTLYYRIKFLKTGYETEAKQQNIVNMLVRDKEFLTKNLIGKRLLNTKKQEYIIISADKDKKDYLFIEFQDTKTIVSRKRQNVELGLVYDNKGATSSTFFNKKTNSKQRRRSYYLYSAMKRRIKTRGAIICDEWIDSYDNFLDWLKNSELKRLGVSLEEFETYEKLKGYELDKNFLKSTNKIYSKETCRLIKKDLNTSIRNMENCNVSLKKDNKIYTITNLKVFLTSLGYEILED